MTEKPARSGRGESQLFTEWVENPDLWIWADFDNENPLQEGELFRKTFALNPFVIDDAQRERHPPKLEMFDDYFLLLMNGLDATTTDIDFKSIQIAFFVSDRFLVTRRNAESVSIDTIWTEAESGEVELASGSAHVAYRILRRVTDRYTNLVEGLQRRLDAMEDEMFENPRDALLEELIGYGRNLKRLWRIFNYHQELFDALEPQGSSLHRKAAAPRIHRRVRAYRGADCRVPRYLGPASHCDWDWQATESFRDLKGGWAISPMR